ncbi:MAG: hypothetical protein RLY20_2870 [Verrucomicrobiota bacterium]|jgi:hypothetical protein
MHTARLVRIHVAGSFALFTIPPPCHFRADPPHR